MSRYFSKRVRHSSIKTIQPRKSRASRRRLFFEPLEDRRLLAIDVHLLKDLNTIAPGEGSFPDKFFSIGATTYFVADDGIHGQELWKTDGSSAGTSMIADLNPSGPSSPKFLTEFGGQLYFQATDGSSNHGVELFKYDGTSISLVADINPTGNSNPEYLTVVGSRLYFKAFTTASGAELRSFDGTTVSLVQEIGAGATSSDPAGLTGVGSTLFFSALSGATRKLYKTTGSGATLVPAIESETDPDHLTSFAGKLYYTSQSPTKGNELFTTDGTTTTRLTDINSGSNDAAPASLTDFGGVLYFSATNGAPNNGRELWRLNGSTPELVSDIQTGGGSSDPELLTVSGGNLFFRAFKAGVGVELWRYSGSGAPTLLEIRAGGASASPDGLTNLNGTLFFAANDGVNGRKLWMVDSGSPALANPVSPFGPSNPASLASIGNTLYFSGEDATFGAEPFVAAPVVASGTISAVITGGNLTVTDTDATGKNNLLTIKKVNVAGTDFLELTDSNESFASAPITIPASQLSNGNKTLRIPFSALTGSLTFDLLGGNDTLTVDYSGGNLGRPVIYAGGSQTTSDTLVLTGGSFATGTFTLANAHDGSIALGSESITYTGLEPVVTTGLTINDLIFTFNGGSETITLADAAGSNMTIDSDLGEVHTFANPSSSLTINAGSGSDIITISSVDSAYRAPLTISGDASTDIINLNASLTLGNGSVIGNLALTAETINLNAATINTDAGTNAGSASFTGDVILGTGVTVDTDGGGADGNVTFGGNINGGNTLLVQAGSGDALFTASLGATNPLQGLTIASADDFNATSIALKTSGVLSVANAGTASVISGPISGTSAGLSKTGTGTLILSSSNTYSGITTVSGGTLLVNGTNAGTGAVSVSNSAILGGTGSIAGVVNVNNTSRLAPGASPETLATGSLALVSGTFFDVEIGGTTPGNGVTGYDQVNVTGGVNLGGSTLNLIQFGGFSVNPSALQTYTMIDNNTDADPVVGIFAGLTEGAAVTYAGGTLYISYFGGDGNDVVLSSQPLVQGTALADDFVITGNGTSFTVTRTNSNGTSTATFVSPPLINILGAGADDSLTVDSTGASTDPIPSGGVFYDGQTQDSSSLGDVLRMSGSFAQSATYLASATTPGAGAVTVAGIGTVNLTGLEPVDMIGFGTANVNFPNGDDLITLTNGFDAATGTLPALVVSGTSGGIGFEQVHLRNVGTANIDTTSVNGATDTVTIASANNAHGISNLTVNTGTGADKIDVVGGISTINSVNLTSQQINLTGLINVTGAASINLAAGTGSIADLNGAGTLNVSGAGIVNASAAGNIELDTTVSTLGSIISSAGNVLLRETNGALVFNVRATLGNVTVSSSTGNLAIDTVVAAGIASLTATTGAITDSGTLNVAADSLVATSATGIDLDTSVTTMTATTTGTGNITIDETDAVTLTSVTTADGLVDISAGNTMTATNVTASGTGRDVRLRTLAGNLAVGSVTALGDVVLLSAASAITDGDGTNDVSALGLMLSAGSGIATAGDPLETTVSNLAWSSGTGGAFISNSGALVITNVTAFSSTIFGGSGSGDAVVSASSPLTVASNVTMGGAITLTAADSAGAGDDLTVGVGVSVTSTGSTITLNAGDNAIINGNLSSTSAGATTTINVDAGDADPGVGGSLTINNAAVITSAAGTFLNGNNDASGDSFTFRPQTTTIFNVDGNDPSGGNVGDALNLDVTATTGPQLAVNGVGAGQWTFTSLHQVVNYQEIEQLAVTGSYHLTVNATGVDDLITVRRGTTPTLLEVERTGIGPTTGFYFNGNIGSILSLTVNTLGGNDTLTVDDVNGLPDFVGTLPGGQNNPLVGPAGDTLPEFLFNGGSAAEINTLNFNLTQVGTSQVYGFGSGSGIPTLHEGEIRTSNTEAIPRTLVIYFTQLGAAGSVNRTGAGATPGSLIVLGDNTATTINIQANAAETRIDPAGYTPFDFSGDNYSALAVHALDGADTLDLIGLGSGQTNDPPITLNAAGQVAAGVLTAAVSDAANDTVRVRSTLGTGGNTGAISVLGGNGNDTYQVFDATGSSQNIYGAITISDTSGNDSLTVDDSGAADGSGDTAFIRSDDTLSQIEGLLDSVASTADISWLGSAIETLDVTATSNSDTVTTNLGGVVAAPTNYNGLVSVSVHGSGGNDTLLLHVQDSIADASLDFVRLFGDAGSDNLGSGAPADRIRPVLAPGQTQIILNGDATQLVNNPTPPPFGRNPTPPAGLAGSDHLFLDMTSTSSGATVMPVVIVDTNGGNADAANTQTTQFTGMELFDLYDNGILTTTLIGDFYVRGTDNPDIITFINSAAAANPQFRVRVGSQIYPRNGGVYGPYAGTGTGGATGAANAQIYVYGRGGNDTIEMYNLQLRAAFFGEAGNDTLTGGTKDDLLVGGAGIDRISSGTLGNEEVWGDDYDPANDPVENPTPANPSADPAILRRQKWALVTRVTDGNDNITTTNGADQAYGGGGTDTIRTAGGNDFLFGGEGNDNLDGQAGDDRVYGGGGNDTVNGGDGNDLVAGNAGNDFVYGNIGNDIVIGGVGVDSVNGNDGNDEMFGGRASRGGIDDSSLAAGDANDLAMLALLADWTPAGGGTLGTHEDDTDADTLWGGNGNDKFFCALTERGDFGASGSDY